MKHRSMYSVRIYERCICGAACYRYRWSMFWIYLCKRTGHYAHLCAPDWPSDTCWTPIRMPLRNGTMTQTNGDLDKYTWEHRND